MTCGIKALRWDFYAHRITSNLTMATKRHFSLVSRSAYLRVLRETGNHVLACESAGVRRQDITRMMEQDDRFSSQVESAQAEATERLEGEAYRRAVIGIEEPVFFMGKPVGTIRRYSDALLGRLLEANDQRFSKQVRVTGQNGGPVEIRHDLTKLSTEQLEALEGILAATVSGEGRVGSPESA